MPQRHPIFILLFLLSVAAVLFLLSALMPSHTLDLPVGISLKFPTTSELLEVKSQEFVDISAVVELADSLTEVDEQVAVVEEEKHVPRVQKHINIDSLRAEAENILRIQFKDSDASSLHAFFKVLEDCAANGTRTHIFHYGDSQIEGDRMTSYIRDRLQKRFGGLGLGFVSLSNRNVVPYLGQSCSDNWHRYPVFSKEGETGKNDNYAMMAAYSSYTAFPVDSNYEGLERVAATAHFDVSKALYTSAKTFKRAVLYYGPVFDQVKLTYALNAGDSSATLLAGRDQLNSIVISAPEGGTVLDLKFESRLSPQFYGISFEGDGGVQMSNIPMRGGSGTVFNKIDRDLLKASFSETNTSLIILQFGGNVLPYIKDEKACADYGRWFYNQIMILRSACPKASIVLIGPADMSLKVDDYFETYTYLEAVRDALKEAAFKAKVGYWDTYEAMGGKNSMPSWVEADPPLAGTDYTHFTPRGARIISELFYKSLMVEYEHHLGLKQQSKSQIPVP